MRVEIKGGREEEGEQVTGADKKDECSVRFSAQQEGHGNGKKQFPFRQKNRKIKDKATLTSVENNICPNMSYSTMQIQLLKGVDYRSLIYKSVCLSLLLCPLNLMCFPLDWCFENKFVD